MRDSPHAAPGEPGEKPGGGEGGYRAQYKRFPLPTYSWRRVGDDFFLVDHNDAAHEFTKGCISGFLGAKASEVLSEKPRLVEAMTRCSEERTTIREEFPHRYLSIEEGEPDEGRCLMVSFVFVSPDLVMVHTEDITERKDAEERLRHAEARYRTLVERMPAVTYIQEIGGPDSAMYMSPQIETLTGYSTEECKDPDLRWRMVHPDDREWLQAEDERDVEPGEVVTTEYRVVHRDGRVVWVRNESVVVKEEGAGRTCCYWQGFMVDITERKRAEERLHHRAFHDPLTGLPNRQLIVDRIGQALRRTER